MLVQKEVNGLRLITAKVTVKDMNQLRQLADQWNTYLLHQSKEYNVGKKRPLVIVCPGGGYAFTSDREAEVIALKFNSIGLNSVVLWYTTGDQVKNVPHNALMEAAQTVKTIRAHAQP